MSNQQGQKLVVLAYNLRSSYNVGSILRTCDGLGVTWFIASGTTPYPALENDSRLPHISLKQTRQIAKTALGAEKSVDISYMAFIEAIEHLKTDSFKIYALEQTPTSIDIRLPDYQSEKIALVVGSETDGLSLTETQLCDQIIEIPMRGAKESFNVAIATGIALWEIRRLSQNW